MENIPLKRDFAIAERTQIYTLSYITMGIFFFFIFSILLMVQVTFQSSTAIEIQNGISMYRQQHTIGAEYVEMSSGFVVGNIKIAIKQFTSCYLRWLVRCVTGTSISSSTAEEMSEPQSLLSFKLGVIVPSRRLMIEVG